MQIDAAASETTFLDTASRRVGWYDNQLVNEIPEATYLDEVFIDGRLESFWLPAEDSYDIEINGLSGEVVEVQLLVPISARSALLAVYQVESVTSEVVAEFRLNPGGAQPELMVDLDGDGQVDQVLEPSSFVSVSLAPFDLFLPVLSSND
jgi:hypothetical protein